MEEHKSGHIVNEKTFLVTVILTQKNTRGVSILGAAGEEPLDELRRLAEAAGTVVVGEMVQRRAAIEPATYIGSGKVQELKGMLEKTGAEVVIFDNDLAPSQTRSLEKELNVKVLDRTELILDIFASRAQTKEARLAVELAQLEYSLPRLKRMWTHLSRQKKGVGLRGPGETQLET
ncbi:MAG: GTPase HflX, partial [Planctomycetia bacterium]|nr:GTPase HflX [Planctomycetia bacterium]